MTIHIDLRDMTREKLDQALNGTARSFYTSPCIIGALMTPEERVMLHRKGMDAHKIGLLLNADIVTMPKEQSVAAVELQQLFDNGCHRDVIQLCNPWVEASAP